MKMLTHIVFVLSGLALISANQTCISRSDGFQICHQDKGPWHGLIQKPAIFSPTPQFEFKGFQVVFTPKVKTFAPITMDQCHFPCFHLGNQTGHYPSGTVPHEDNAIAAYKYGGYVSSWMDGSFFPNLGLCQASDCLSPAPMQGNWLLDLEYQATHHPGRPAFLASRFALHRWADRVMCYGSTAVETLAYTGEFGCSDYLWNGYDSHNTCHLLKDWTDAQITYLSWAITHHIAVPFYGYIYRGSARTNEQCVEGYTVTRYPVIPNFQSSGCAAVARPDGSYCVFPTPTQIRKFFRNDLTKTTTKSYLGWSNFNRDIRNRGNLHTKMTKIMDSWKFWGPEMFAAYDPQTRLRFEGSSTDSCQWMENIRIDPETMCFSGQDKVVNRNHPQFVCSLRCNHPISAHLITTGVPYLAQYRAPPSSLAYTVVGNGFFLQGWTTGFATHSQGSCVSSSNSTVFCEGVPQPRMSFCGFDQCRDVDLIETKDAIHTDFGDAISGGFYPVGTHPQPRIKRSPVSGFVTLHQTGTAVHACSYDKVGPRKCSISDGQHQRTWDCSTDECCHDVSPLTFGHGDLVTLSCGEAVGSFTWSPPGAVFGSLTGAWAFASFVEQPWWVQFLIVLLCVWVARMFFSFLQLDWVVSLGKIVGRFILVITDLPRYIYNSTIVYWWAFRQDKVCDKCCAPRGLMRHRPDNTCPYGKEAGKCPWCSADASVCHWLKCHTFELVPIAFWLNIFNIVKKTRLELECLNMEPSKIDIGSIIKNRGKSSVKKPLLGMAILGLIIPASGLANVVATSSCTNGTCITSTQIVQEGLWTGDQSCYKVAFTEGDYSFCVYTGPTSVTASLPINFCRNEFEVPQYSRIFCASNKGCSGEHPVEGADGCFQVWNQERKHDGNNQWGCFFPNLNSACIKAWIRPTSTKTPCVALFQGTTSVTTPVCVYFQGKEVCSTNGEVHLPHFKLRYTLEAETKVNLPPRVMIYPDGRVHKVADDDNGCFFNKREGVLSKDCAGTIPGLSCKWTVYHWWDARVECEVTDPTTCNSAFAYPKLDSSCNLTSAHINTDSNTASVDLTGCASSTFKITGTALANVTIDSQKGSVTTLEVTHCGGEQGVGSEASCIVRPLCNGVTMCHLTTPVVMDLHCGLATQVIFTAESGAVEFTCGGVSAAVNISLDTHKQDNFIDPDPQGGKNYGGVFIPWWVWLIVAVSIFLLIVLIYGFCQLSKVKKQA